MTGNQLLPQTDEFKYFRLLLTSQGRKEREIDRQIGWCSICSVADVVLICGDEESCRFTGQCKFLLSPTATSGGL